VVGPNGAGKSTLFNVISGFQRPREGRVEFDGHDITRLAPQVRARRGMARTFQHPELFVDLTIREHLILAARLRAKPRRVWLDTVTGAGLRLREESSERDRVEQLLESLNLTQDADRTAEGLPLGVARRVELGRALAFEPSLLLLDEPSSGLDNTETAQFAAVLLNAVDEHGVALVLVEHDVDLVLGISDRVYVLDFGKVIASGEPADIRRDPAVQAAYLGEDPDEAIETTTTGGPSHD